MSSLTDFLSLYKPVNGDGNANSQNWSDELNDNLDLIDQRFQGLQGLVNVKDPQFGAVGDGVTNDQPAFNAALAYLGAVNLDRGGLFIIPPGTYMMNDQFVIGQQNVFVIADGATIVTAGGLSGVEMSSHHCRIRGLTIDHRSNASAVAGFWIYGHGVGEGGGTHHLTDCMVLGDDSLNANYAAYRVGDNPYVTPDAYGTTGSYWNVFDHCAMIGASATSFPYGFLLEGASNSTRIMNCRVGHAADGVRIQNQPTGTPQGQANSTVIFGTAFEGVGKAIVLHSGDDTNMLGLSIIGCRFEVWDVTLSITGSYSQYSQPPLLLGNSYILGAAVAHFENVASSGPVFINSLDPSIVPNLGAGTMALYTSTNPLQTHRVDVLNQLRVYDGSGNLVGTLNGAGSILNIVGTTKFNGQLGFFNHAVSGQPTVSGSKGGNAALSSLLSALAGMGLVIDTTT